MMNWTQRFTGHLSMTRVTAVAAAACLAGLWTASGCNIVGPAVYLATGMPDKEAEYVLQVERPTVVVLDDRRNLVSPTSFRRVIADTLSQELLDRQLVTTVITPRDAMAAVSRDDTHSDPLSVEEIGQAVGAEVVVYVEMMAFSRTNGAASPRPFAAADVRIVDVVNREVLFPAAGEEPGEPRQVSTMLREVDPATYRSRAAASQVYEQLATSLGLEIAKLFYKHEPRELGSQLQPR